MELRQLERFLAVYDHGSLANAARVLGLTQQTLSASLANLEESLGLRLFDRTPGGVTRPTECGQALVRHARAQISADRRAQEELRSINEGQIGTVTIGVGEAFAGDIIAAAVSAMQARQPDVRINLVEGYSEQLRHQLYDGEFDFIAAGVSAFELDDDYAREAIYSSDDIVVCRSHHPLTKRKRLRLADLQGYPWLVPYSRPSDLQIIVETFAAEELQPPSRLIGSDAYRLGMQLLMQEDLLMMVAPALVAPELARQPIALVQLPIKRPTIRRNASLIYPRKRPISPPAQQLLQEVRKQAADARQHSAPVKPAKSGAGGRP